MKLAIIGTAGRRDDGQRLDIRFWIAMQQKALQAIQDINRKLGHRGITGLISGGAAWADHLAVRLFLDHSDSFNTLTLFFPCSFDFERNEFRDTGEQDWRANPGGTLNHYHRRFTRHLGTPGSLYEISEALTKHGANHCVNLEGLHARNTDVAKASDAIVAFTFGAGPVLKDGGTADTMRKFQQFHPNGLAYHVDLNTMLAWRKAELAA